MRTMNLRILGRGKISAVGLFITLTFASLAHAGPVTYDLNFQTSGQSIWNSGESFTLNETKFIGAQWNDQTTSIGGIVGNNNTQVPNPARIAYDGAFATCRLAASASACINGQSARVPVPRLGSRPSVRSCGRFAVSCNIKRAADLVRRGSYDVALRGCRALGNSSSTCRNGRSGRLPVPALGTAPPSTLEIDTRTGLEVSGTTDGRVGLELGITVDSGSVDATVEYAAELDIPDTMLPGASRTINFNANSSLNDGQLDTTFANLGLSVDAVLELSGNVSAEACFVAAGCTAGGTTFNIDETAPILSFNEDSEGGILVFGQTPSDLFLPIPDGFPLDIETGPLTTTLHLPAPDATGGLDASSGTLKASGQDDLVDLSVDLADVVASSVGAGGLLSRSFDVGPGSVGYTIIEVNAGPSVDLAQDFELDPTLFASLSFDTAVEVGGEMVTELVAAWDSLPDITFLSDITTVIPTFFLESTLLNETLLDFDFDFGIDLLSVNYDFGILGKDEFGIGNVLDKGIDLFKTPAFYRNEFALGGFNLQIGDSFVIDFTNGSSGPDSTTPTSAANPVVLVANPESVPEPSTLLLMLGGLLVLVNLRRKAIAIRS